MRDPIEWASLLIPKVAGIVRPQTLVGSMRNTLGSATVSREYERAVGPKYLPSSPVLCES